MNVANGKTIRRLTTRFLKASKVRNIIVIGAIILTAMLFTSVFTIGGNMLAAIQDYTMRQVGTSAHGGLKYLTMEQYEDFADSPLIEDISYSRFLAVAENEALKKLPSEIRCAEDKMAQWAFSLPAVGRMPEGDNEVACSTIVLNALGVPHELGASVPLEFTVGDKTYSKRFILSGYWKGDPVMMVQQIWFARGYGDSLLASSAITDGYTGAVSADVWFGNSFDIQGKMQRLIAERGYLEQEVNYGVNWAYMASEIEVDPMAVATALLLLALILLSGYLIIYSIFAISVTSDTHSYGLLKTIGATGRQIRKIVRGQALVLSAIGIPTGLVLGYVMGILLTPLLLDLMAGDVVAGFSAVPNPLVFVFAAVFSLLTVFIGCRKPSKIAARISPMEALRYEGSHTQSRRRSQRKARRTRRLTMLSLAWANVTREKRRLAVIVLSLSLSLVLLNSAFSATRSFNMDAYIADSIISDFAVTDSTILSYATSQRDFEGVSPEFLDELLARGATDIASVYYQDEYEHRLQGVAYENFLEAVSALNSLVEREQPQALSFVETCVSERFLPTQIYGAGRLATESFYPHYDKLASGDYALVTTLLSDSTEHPVYGVGDTVTLTNAQGETRSFEVIGLLAEYPFSISARQSFIPGQIVVVSDAAFLDFYGERGAMQVNFNVGEEYLSEMESWLASYTTEVNPELSYVSRETLKAEFGGLQATYLTLGGVLSFILALIGILNFINAITASIVARRHEFAVLQSVGMTGRQLRQTLFLEGVCFVALTALFTLTIGLGLSLLIVWVAAGQVWFFEQSFTAMPSVLCLVPLLLICAVVPILCYSKFARTSLVERLRVE